jgi:hypothetical protein
MTLGVAVKTLIHPLYTYSFKNKSEKRKEVNPVLLRKHLNIMAGAAGKLFTDLFLNYY